MTIDLIYDSQKYKDAFLPLRITLKAIPNYINENLRYLYKVTYRSGSVDHYYSKYSELSEFLRNCDPKISKNVTNIELVMTIQDGDKTQ